MLTLTIFCQTSNQRLEMQRFVIKAEKIWLTHIVADESGWLPSKINMNCPLIGDHPSYTISTLLYNLWRFLITNTPLSLIYWTVALLSTRVRLLSLETFPFSKGLGFGLVKIWSLKKSGNQFRKNLVLLKCRMQLQIFVSSKVLYSVSQKFGLKQSLGFGLRKKSWSWSKTSLQASKLH